MNRRDWLKWMALETITLPLLLQAEEKIPLASKLSGALPGVRQGTLILLELKGGNDGLNTVIPYGDPNYHRLRPKLAIDKKSILPIDDMIGLHPSMQKMHNIYDEGDMAIVQGLGYPHPNRSHFRSIEIWDTASGSDRYLDRGWIASLLAGQRSKLNAVILGGEFGPMSAMEQGAVKVANIKRFFNQSRQIGGHIYLTGENPQYRHILMTEMEIRKSADILRKYVKKSTAIKYPYAKNPFGRQLELATKLIESGANIPYLKITLNGFDTHINQLQKHTRLLGLLSEGLGTLRQNLKEFGVWDDTLVMTYSEFGRRPAENASGGTDHGTAAPHFILGGKIKGGLYGETPSLEHLDKNSDLIFTTDYRSYYQTIASKFIRRDLESIDSFGTMPFL